MRAPRQPKKPRRIAPTCAERDGGGELTQRIPSAEDYVPTAPMAPLEDELDHADSASVEGDSWVGDSPAEDAHAAEDDTGDEGEPENTPAAPETAAREEEKSAVLTRVTSPARRAGRSIHRRLTYGARASIVDSELHARRLERESEARRIRMKRVGIGMGVVALVALVGWILLGSPLLRYQYAPAQITGYAASSIVDRGKLEAMVAERDGENLLLLNTDALAHDITTAIPEVAAVAITKDYRHDLQISISEAVPVACLGQEGACTAVTAEGTELNIPDEISASLPHINHTGDGDRARAIADALNVLGALGQSVLNQVSEVTIANGDLVTLHLTDGRTVYWGGLDRASFKADVLAALLTQPFSYFDVSVPDAPVSR